METLKHKLITAAQSDTADETLPETMPTQYCDCLDGMTMESGGKIRCDECDYWEGRIYEQPALE